MDKEAETIYFKDANTFDSWLAKNYQKQEGVWMKMAKKDSGIPSVTSDEAVDIGLCWGWISGIRKGLDDKYYLQKYVPRRPRSIWSQVNVEKIEQLTAAGKMQPSGIAEVEAAKSDGRWDAAYASQRNSTVPDDLAEALEKNKKAKAKFDTLNKTEKYQIIMHIEIIRTAETRAAKIRSTIQNLAS